MSKEMRKVLARSYLAIVVAAFIGAGATGLIPRELVIGAAFVVAAMAVGVALSEAFD